MHYVFASAEETLQHAPKSLIYIQKSTVPVGTGKKIEELFTKKAPEKAIDYISNPELLREGIAISDALFFDRVVVGGNNKAATNIVRKLHRHPCR